MSQLDDGDSRESRFCLTMHRSHAFEDLPNSLTATLCCNENAGVEDYRGTDARQLPSFFEREDIGRRNSRVKDARTLAVENLTASQAICSLRKQNTSVFN